MPDAHPAPGDRIFESSEWKCGPIHAEAHKAFLRVFGTQLRTYVAMSTECIESVAWRCWRTGETLLIGIRHSASPLKRLEVGVLLGL